MEPDEYAALASLEDDHWWYRGMAALAREAVTALPLPRPARILDAGCGAGGNLRWLSGFGPAVGVDSSPLAAALTRRKTGAAPVRASVCALPFPTNHFHLIASFEVLYHSQVPDDMAALGEFWRALAPGGWLALRLPAHNWLRGAHDARVHTARRYGLAELRDKLARAGFRVRRLTPVGLWLLPGAVLARGAQALLGLRGGRAGDLRLPPARLNRLLAAALCVEGRWAARRRLPWGLSLFALARKPEGRAP